MDDPRRNLPRTDDLLAHPAIAAFAAHLHPDVIRSVVRTHLARGRTTHPVPSPTTVVASIATELTGLRDGLSQPVINATGVVIHTNLGRAPLSHAATQALTAAAGYIDVEFDLTTGERSSRGRVTADALLARLNTGPDQPERDAVIVNNCAAALMLIAAHFAPLGPIVLSRGEFVEIGAGFRLHELMEATGATFAEVGATNRTHLTDYRRALQAGECAAILRVHPSNYRQDGFTSAPTTRELSALAREFDVPLIVDIGSGLLNPIGELAAEPDATSALKDGADLVVFSGDKLLGGPQAGVAVGAKPLVRALSRHPLYRAVRPDKTTLAALLATVTAGDPPTHTYIRATATELRSRCERVAQRVRAACPGVADIEVRPHVGRVGGGGGTGVELRGFAVSVGGVAVDELARALRTGKPAIVPHVTDGVCYLDVRCIDPALDEQLADGLIRALEQVSREQVGRG